MIIDNPYSTTHKHFTGILLPGRGDWATEGAMEGAQDAEMDMVSKTPPRPNTH